MSRKTLSLHASIGWITVLCATGGVACASAGETDDKINRLEALLEQQQSRIDSLETQLVDARSQDQDAARVDAMKQQIREVLSESDFRESLMPSVMQAGYDHGFYIRSADNDFYMRINGRFQFRFTHYGTRSSNRYLLPRRQRDDRTGFDVQRMRFGFRGNAWGQDFTYRFEFQADAGARNDARARYAWVNYKFSEAFQVKAGIFKIASTRGQMTSSGSLQFVDRSVTDAVFEYGRGLGVRFWGHLFDKKLDYYIDVVNSFNSTSNRTISPDPAEHDNTPALALHLVWHALGENPGKDFKAQADHAKHESPALDLGFHYAFNADQGDARTTRIPFPARRRLFGSRGGFGLTTTNGLQTNQFGFEAAFKLRGFSATGEYILRIVDPRRATRRPFTPWFLLTGQGSTTVMHGAYVQVGYFLPIPGYEDKLEAVARVGGISTQANGTEGTWEYAGGLNYYLQKDKVKLQTDVTKVTEVPISSNSHSLANVNDDALIWRVQMQFAF